MCGVMPMEKFVSCVGDLVTLVSWVGRDLGPATPLVYVLFFLSLFCLSAWRWGVESFTPALFFLHCDRVEFLRCSDGSRTREESGRWINTRLGRKCIAGLLQTFADFSGFLLIMDYLLRSAVYRSC